MNALVNGKKNTQIERKSLKCEACRALYNIMKHINMGIILTYAANAPVIKHIFSLCFLHVTK